MKKIYWFISFWIPVLIWMLLIFYFSSLPGREIPFFFFHQDILFHLLVYALLVYLFSRAMDNTYAGLPVLKLMLFSVFFGILYGMSDEVHQLFVPGRECSVLDLSIDGAGSCVGGFIYRWLR